MQQAAERATPAFVHPECPVCNGRMVIPQTTDWAARQFVEEFLFNSGLRYGWELEAIFHGRREVTKVVTARIILHGKGITDSSCGIGIHAIMEPAVWKETGYVHIFGSTRDPVSPLSASPNDAELLDGIRTGWFPIFKRHDGERCPMRLPIAHIVQRWGWDVPD